MPVDFSWTVRTGLVEMQLKIERDESGTRRGSGEQVPATVSGVLEPLAVSDFKITRALMWISVGTAAAVCLQSCTSTPSSTH